MEKDGRRITKENFDTLLFNKENDKPKAPPKLPKKSRHKGLRKINLVKGTSKNNKQIMKENKKLKERIKEIEKVESFQKFLMKEVETLKEQNEKLKKGNSIIFLHQLKEELEKLSHSSYKKKCNKLKKEAKDLFKLKSIDGKEKEVKAIESKLSDLIIEFEGHVNTLTHKDLFIVLDSLLNLKKNKDSEIEGFKKYQEEMKKELTPIQLLKELVIKNESIEKDLKRMKKYIDQIHGLVYVVKEKFKPDFIRKNVSLEKEIKQYNDINKNVKEIQVITQKKFVDIKKIFDEHGYMKKYFIQYDKKMKEHMEKFDQCVSFLQSVKDIYSQVKTFSKLIKLPEIRIKTKEIKMKQKERTDLNNNIEREFKKVILRGDKDINRCRKLTFIIKNEINDVLRLISVQNGIIINFQSEINKISVLSKSCESFQTNLIKEMNTISEGFTQYLKSLSQMIVDNELSYGKIYGVENKSIGGMFSVKKKKLIYFGQMKDNMKHGTGKEFYDDGKTVNFYGKFQYNERSGMGVEYDRRGIVLNKGEFAPKEIKLKCYDLSKLMKTVDPIKDLLGKGSFGEVYKVMPDKGGSTFAMKRLFLSKENLKEIERFKNEVRILSKLRHPNIISIFGYGEYEDENSFQFGIVVEYCPKKIKPKGMHFDEKIRIILEIAQGMDFLHSKDIIHRDLKFENVLINKFNQVKIIDFGISKQLETYKLTQNIAKTQVMGTPGYIAPEVLGNQDYTNKCDVFSYGIMMYVMLFETDDPYRTATNKDPFYSFKLSELISNGLRPPIPKDYKIDYVNNWYVVLMKECWNGKQHERPSFRDIITIILKNYG